jgi:uncharacterized protein (TIRG00374 family)
MLALTERRLSGAATPRARIPAAAVTDPAVTWQGAQMPRHGLSQEHASRSSGDSFQLFASAPSDPRARRPVDALRAIAYLLLLVLAALLSEIGRDLDEGLSDVLTSFPGFLKVLWRSGFCLAVGWSVALLVIAVFRKRQALALEGLAAATLTLGIAAVTAAIVSGDAGDVITRIADWDGPPVFPPAALAMTCAVLAVMAPYLTLPFRRVGRALIVAQMLGSLFLGVSHALGTVASLAIGLLAGTAMHLLRGSPGGFPTATRVRAALEDLGVDVDQLAPTMMRREGVAMLTGTDRHGAIHVSVYGRDAWEGELLADLWRLAWFRGRRRSARLSRSEYVEHEGFVTMLASRSGVRVPEVVTAGLADNGDALIVVRPDGQPLGDTDPRLSADQVRLLWDQLRRLHDGGIVHHRVDLDRVVTRDDGSAGFSDLSSASVRSQPVDVYADRAQLLSLTVVASDEDVAVDAAVTALGHDGVIAMLPYLQEAGLPPLVHLALRRRHIELDAIRTRLTGQLDAPDIELVKLRRVTWKSLLNLALLAVAAYTIIGMLSGLDLNAFFRSLGDANWRWLLAALLIGQLPRFANALSTMGSTPQPLPFGPTVALQFATCYVNLAVPSSAGRVAITTRFFQRFGIPPAAAFSAGLIDSLSEFVVQATLFLIVFFISDVDLGLSLDTDQLNGVATTALIVIVVLLVAAVIAIAVPSLRHRLVVGLREARDALHVLRNPRRLVQLYGGNLLSQLLFAMTLGACVRAFGFELPLSTLILINTVVSLFAGLLPVPGGVGVSEAGLALGLTRAGIPSETAFAIALTNRFATFYLPPIWGLLSYRWMTSRHYL